MFNKIYKLILFLLVFGYSIYQFTLDNIGNGIALIFLSLIFLLLYFKNEIFILPDETLVYCGHGNETTIKAEKSFNPFLR